MPGDSGYAALESEVRSLRRELAELRAEQREMARAIDQMTQTFRSIATHLGIAAEPYRRAAGPDRRGETPGFA